MILEPPTVSPSRPRLRTAMTLFVLVAVFASPLLVARELPETSAPVDVMAFRGEPVSFSLRDAEIREVLTIFAQLGDLQLEVAPEVEGNVTVELHEVPWDEALYRVLQGQGLVYEVTDGVVHIRPGKLPPLVASPRVVAELEGTSYYDGQGVQGPRFEGGPAPLYPEEARSGGINGTVVIECLIDPQGTVRSATVVESNADVLSAAALDVIWDYRFRPATLDGRPVGVRWRVPIRFSL